MLSKPDMVRYHSLKRYKYLFYLLACFSLCQQKMSMTLPNKIAPGDIFFLIF